MVNQESQETSTEYEELNPESVQITADCSLVLEKHEEDVGDGTEDEEDLDGSVVKRYNVGEDVHVAGDENQQKQDLRLARNTLA